MACPMAHQVFVKSSHARLLYSPSMLLFVTDSVEQFRLKRCTNMFDQYYSL